MADHEFKILDNQARADFEKLLGHEIKGSVVCMMHDTYVKHAAGIQDIQTATPARVARRIVRAHFTRPASQLRPRRASRAASLSGRRCSHRALATYQHAPISNE